MILCETFEQKQKNSKSITSIKRLCVLGTCRLAPLTIKLFTQLMFLFFTAYNKAVKPWLSSASISSRPDDSNIESNNS